MFDILDYCWRHPKRTKTFTGGWTYVDMMRLCASWPKEGIRVVLEGTKLVAVIFFEIKTNSLLHIRHILCDTTQAFLQLSRLYKRDFPGWLIESTRPAGLYKDTQKLIRKLSYAR